MRNSGGSVGIVGRFTAIPPDGGGRRAPSVHLPLPAMRLLALLAAEPDGSRRDHLAFTLWPDSGERQAQQSLRGAVYAVQHRAPGLVHADRTQIHLEAAVSVDLLSYRALVRAVSIGRLPRDPEALIGALASELVPGWYDEWVIPFRDQWRDLRVGGLEGLSDLLRRVGDHDLALRAARHAAQVDPLRESSRRAVIAAHLALGNAASARQEFATYAATIDSELQVGPSERLRSLMAGADSASTEAY